MEKMSGGTDTSEVRGARYDLHDSTGVRAGLAMISFSPGFDHLFTPWFRYKFIHTQYTNCASKGDSIYRDVS